MARARWIFLGLIAVFMVALIYVSSDPEMSSRYAQAVRDAQLSTEVKDLVLGGLVIAIGGYLAWFLLVRKG
jgi:hypothetical protein